MAKILIFGNAGAGKSTLAKKLCDQHHLEHLDLDTLAWLPVMPPRRRLHKDSLPEIESFMATHHEGWVIEGCYSDLLTFVTPLCTEIIFLNPGTEACIAHCRTRPWEPHKYESQAAQDADLDILIKWVKSYETRKDEFSLASHQKLFDSFQGKKTELAERSNDGRQRQ